MFLIIELKNYINDPFNGKRFTVCMDFPDLEVLCGV